MKRPSKKDTGKTGELAALKYLKSKRYVILQQNYRNICGEIDIIARKVNCLVFIEVKTRTGSAYGSPLESIDAAKTKRIRRAADLYIAGGSRSGQDIRFDVITVMMHKNLTGKEVINNNHMKIDHLKNAF